MKRNEVGKFSFIHFKIPWLSQFFPPQVVRFVAALSKLKAKGRDWKSTLLSEVGALKTTIFKIVIF